MRKLIFIYFLLFSACSYATNWQINFSNKSTYTYIITRSNIHGWHNINPNWISYQLGNMNKMMPVILDDGTAGPEGIDEIDYVIKVEGNPDLEQDVSLVISKTDRTAAGYYCENFVSPFGPLFYCYNISGDNLGVGIGMTSSYINVFFQ